ncbi:alpha/beta hydrolase [Sphingomonas sp.]|uniref:alpha/beta hydrolase n=1 Tax=Sphingomonas sp. TaxID=28214 RepID=UPI001D4E239D|nr:alpha/beta hydrolase [Sphingomonas sp.]MBX9796209.1 alpha/beta hydrolase [Sphingomonas sp.]
MRHRPLALFAAMLFLCGMADWKPLTWPDLTRRPRPAPDATISYGSDPYQRVDLWLPAGKRAAPHPIVVMVHGGCWQTEIADRSLMNWVADNLRKRGYAVWNIDYRGVDRPGGGYPGTFTDVATATDLLRDYAARYRLDLRHIVAVGHSAGGHLALWLAARAAWQADRMLVVEIETGDLPPEDAERGMAGPVERELRKLADIDGISTHITPGKAVTLANFKTAAAQRRAAASAANWLPRPVAGRATVRSARAALPAGSPVAAGNALPIDSVVSLGGLPDLKAVAESPDNGCGTDVVARLTGAPSAARPDVFVDTSVPRLFPIGVVQWLVAGEEDRIIPTHLTEGYFAQARDAMEPVRLARVPQTGHVELVTPESAAWQQAAALITLSYRK